MNNPDAILQVEQVSADSFLCRFPQAPSPELTQRIIAISEKLNEKLEHSLKDHVIAYNTLLLTFQQAKQEPLNHQKVIQEIKSLFSESEKYCTVSQEIPQGTCHQIPVCYDQQFGPDLDDLAKHASLSIEEVIQRHTAKPYHVYATGFQPGFAFLGFVENAIAMPRLATPRQSLAPGSVGIADRQTGIYPRSSPAGWRIIGRTPQDLQPVIETPPEHAAENNTTQSDMIPNTRTPNATIQAPEKTASILRVQPTLQVGDHVQFYAISVEEFNQIISTSLEK